MAILDELPESSSSSSSSSTYRRKYDVFLSFRGLDTRSGFTSNLCYALKNANLDVFMDDEEIETGLYLKPELESAIRSSRASIIVLSRNYASSTWCLNEVVLILEQHRQSNHIVFPIFYGVEPTIVRKQQDSFKDAMENHKKKMNDETDAEKKSQWAQKLETWSNALTNVADAKGIDAKGRDDTELIEDIVSEMYRRLGQPLSTRLPQLIGMNSYISFIASWLRDGSSHTADILTILGISGIGKTSLAEYVYGLHFHEYTSRSSFVHDIRRRCERNGLLEVQKQLLANISKPSSVQVYDPEKYTLMIEKSVQDKKVFLVLDDVDSLEQLDALLGKKGFYPGSKIIITTKDASLTERCNLFISQLLRRNHLELKLPSGLHEKDSLKLLCRHAFQQNGPKIGYKEVSKKLVKYCGGHPLALEILGRSLVGRDVDYWKHKIELLEKEPDSEIGKKLQLSFDSLPSRNDKELFKHIACFFVGSDREYTATIVKGCGIHAELGIKTLHERCLLSIGRNNELMMHPLVQEMGRDVVCQESPQMPWMRTRLWRHDESFTVLKEQKGSANLIGLTLDMRNRSSGLLKLKTEAFEKMPNLKLLNLSYVQIKGSYEKFPKELRWLCLHGIHLESVPSLLRMESLVVLHLTHSNIESFNLSYTRLQQIGRRILEFVGVSSQDNQMLGSLKILDLSFCKQLSHIGGFSKLPQLERLILSNCVSLTQVCESLGNCFNVVLIDFSNCEKLKTLPVTMANLKKMTTLTIDGCRRLKIPFDMSSLHTLNANNMYNSSETPSSANGEAIPRYPEFFNSNLPNSLVSLSLRNNNLSSESFPMDFSRLSMLKTLDLSENPLVFMPHCVRTLQRLTTLELRKCEMLKMIERPPSALRNLILDGVLGVQKLLFNPRMSPLNLEMGAGVLVPSSIELEGIIKIQPLAGIEKELLRSLGWSNLEFLEERHIETSSLASGEMMESQIQMYYEFGIFSTIYGGEGMPNWIMHRSKGSSISFTIPSSPKKIRGLNISYEYELQTKEFNYLLYVIVNNITKKQTWIYHHHVQKIKVAEECAILLSHWMFSKNELEEGDIVSISISMPLVRETSVRECGVSFVYDDHDGTGSMEEDPLAYYRLWNHIIGGDLSFYQTQTGEYLLRGLYFVARHDGMLRCYRNILGTSIRYKVPYGYIKFIAFSQRKPDDDLAGAPKSKKRREL